eukprot:XP_028338690.1 melanoma-associated antigen B4-like [Physeter catodon]
MPRVRKSKRRACVNRQQARGETQSLKGAQATEAAAAEIEESPSYPASVSRGISPSSRAARSLREPQGAPATSSRDAGVSYPGSEEGAQSQDEKSANTSQAAPSTHGTCRDPLYWKVGMLVHFLLEKYKTKEPIRQAAMLKAVNRKYKKHFPEILKRASDHMELVFGLELKEVDPSNHSYILISKLALPSEGSPSDESGLPKSGLLMILLGTIFTNGNRATEEEIWEFLNALGLYAGRRHLIFGEPRRLISKYFVQQKYLTYRQVPNSDPPRYEFLWGPRAHAETSKMKVLEFVAKINDTVPSAFPELYEEAAAAAEIEESPSSPASSVSRGTPPSSRAARSLREPQGAPATSSRDAGVSYPGSEEGAQSQDEKSANTSQAAPSTHGTCRDPLYWKVGMLVHFLLEKYKTKEPIRQAAMLKAVNRKYKKHFPEILKRASDHMELVFGLELKEVDPSNHSYILISKLPFPSEEGPSDESGLPKSGLLMILLGTIFTNGNRATEEEIWEFLNALGLYAGRRHLIFGEPRRLISKYFVQQKYLTYRQVPNSDPPRYEFLWGPRAHAETSKMKVLEFVAKINDTVPSAFPELYEEALKDEEERARVRAAARAAAGLRAVRLPGPRPAAPPTSREGGRGQFVPFVLEESS